MLKRRVVSIAPALILGLTAPCLAMNAEEQRQIQNMTQPGQPLSEEARSRGKSSQAGGVESSPFLRASKIIGARVRNSQGENLGDIKDVVLDTEAGQIVYAVVSFGGFLGVGDKLFAVPWKTLRQEGGDSESGDYVLNVDKEMLKNAPGFDEDTWPDMANRSWQDDVYRYYDNLVPYQPEVRPR